MDTMFDTKLPMTAAAVYKDAPLSLEDLRSYVETKSKLSDKTKERYVQAIAKAGLVLNLPLSNIPASLDLVEATFPLNGFDPAWWRSEKAYKQFRRRLQAPLKEFLGIEDALQKSRDQQDGWYFLITACVEKSAGVQALAGYHRTKFPSLTLLADIAREKEIQPDDIDEEVAGHIYRAASSRKRETISKGLKLLDKLRDYEFAVPYLPTKKVNFSAFRLRQQQDALPGHWVEDFDLAYEMMNEQHVDPVSNQITQLSRETRAGFMAAMRGLARTHLKAYPNINPKQSWIELCSSRDNVTELATLMIDRCKLTDGAEGKIEPRTARKYLCKLARLLHEFEPGSTGLEELTKILKNNEILQEGKEADTEMTPENIKFCQNLFTDQKLEIRFLTSYKIFYDEALELIDGIEAQGRSLKDYEKIRLRWLGTFAAFCALELGGMPIRNKNAMGLTMHGVDAQIKILQRSEQKVKVRIPKGLVKNKKAISFDIKPHKNGYLDVLYWYVDFIRPMFEYADQNPYFFPAPQSATKPMSEGYFSRKFEEYTRSVLGLPMTPHQMRHGQVSLLLRKHPKQIYIIAHRIGDTLQTMFNYYGWIDELAMIEEGQKMIAEMTDE